MTINSFLFLKKNLGTRWFWVVIGMLVVASGLRVAAYGNIGLSIATNDTQSYLDSSQAPLFSREILTGRRLLTTNLFYKFFEPEEGYQITANGSFDTTRRVFQHGFEKIVIVQVMLSILSWSILALTISGFIHNPAIKILSTIILILFAFTPQIADWDSVLMSESLTFSLFALQLALLIKIAFAITESENVNISFLSGVWFVIYFLWTFLRDSNLVASAVTVGMISILLIIPSYRKNKKLYIIVSALIAMLGIGFYTSSHSTRSIIQINNIYNSDLLINPAWVNTLNKLGMPEPHSDEYKIWFPDHAGSTLIKFFAIHPSYPARKVIKDFAPAFTEFKQTYFKSPEQITIRNFMLPLGEAIHPENTTPFLLGVCILFALAVIAIQSGDNWARVWAWILYWLFLTASFTIIAAILGDAWALSRHSAFSTMVYRLLMWVGLVVIIDKAVQTQKSEKMH